MLAVLLGIRYRVTGEESALMVLVVASHAAALAPFSQNSAVLRWVASGQGAAGAVETGRLVELGQHSGGAQGPISRNAKAVETSTALSPAATVLGGPHA